MIYNIITRALSRAIYAWAHYHTVVTLAHVQSNPFYHPFYPDVTHVRKDIRPSPAFSYCNQRKTGWGPGNEAMVFFLPYVENVYFLLWFPFSPHSLLPSLLLGLFLPSLSTILPHFLPLPHLPHHFLPLILPSTSVHSLPPPSLIFSSQFKKIQTAYEILSNAEKREMYDRFGMDGVKDDGGPGAGK